MPENDQTRWIGVRPTNPPETIPVSMAAAPPCAKVEPCAANTAFNTITKKLTPAISDLQAIEKVIKYNYRGLAGGTGAINKDTPAVPAGKLWMVTQAIMWNHSGTTGSFYFKIMATAQEHWCGILITPAQLVCLELPQGFVMEPDEYFRFMFNAPAGAGNTIVCNFRAYQVNQY